MTPTEQEARRRAARLRAEITHHDHKYYVEHRPEISDGAYDRLYRQLQALEEAFPHLVTPDSPTQRVGADPLSELPVVEHVVPMLSLDSSEAAEDLRRFDERMRKAVDGPVEYLVEPKLDGSSLEVVYVDGVLDRAVTRGNGMEGEGVTENARTIRSLPLRLRAEPGDEAATRAPAPRGDTPAPGNDSALPSLLSVRGRSAHVPLFLRGAEQEPGGGRARALRQPPQRGGGGRCGSWTRASRGRARWSSSPTISSTSNGPLQVPERRVSRTPGKGRPSTPTNRRSKPCAGGGCGCRSARARWRTSTKPSPITPTLRGTATTSTTRSTGWC